MIWLALLLAQTVTDPSASARGEKIFAQNCSVGYCHGVGGAAGRGPRLRGRTLDKNYLYKVTRDGIPNSAMPAWKDRLKDDEIGAVVAYMGSIATASAEAPPANPMPPGTGPAAVSAFKGPAQAERGHRLFFDAVQEIRCGTCHSLGGRGIAIGPDLTASASKTPKEMAEAIRSNRSQHVVTAKLNNDESFPALRVQQDENWVKLYDLTTPPPVLRTLNRGEIVSITESSNWGHDAVVKHLTLDQVADIIAFIRWAASGEKSDVSPGSLR